MFKKTKDNEYELMKPNNMVELANETIDNIMSMSNDVFNEYSNTKFFEDVLSRIVISKFLEEIGKINLNTVYKVFINLDELHVLTICKLDNNNKTPGIFHTLVKI